MFVLCRNAKRKLKKALMNRLGHYSPHPAIMAESESFYHQDGVYISEDGVDLFLAILQQGLREALGVLVGASA